MRTTIRLPDDLYRRVRLTAAGDDATVTSFIEQALREALRRHDARDTDSASTYRIRPFAGRGLRPGVDLDDSAALLDVMEPR